MCGRPTGAAVGLGCWVFWHRVDSLLTSELDVGCSLSVPPLFAGGPWMLRVSSSPLAAYTWSQAYPEVWRSMVKSVRRPDGDASPRFVVKLEKREVVVTAETPEDAARWVAALEKAATAVRSFGEGEMGRGCHVCLRRQSVVEAGFACFVWMGAQRSCRGMWCGRALLGCGPVSLLWEEVF